MFYVLCFVVMVCVYIPYWPIDLLFIWIRWLLFFKKLSNLHTSVMLWLRRQSSALIRRSSINNSYDFGWIWPHLPPISNKWPLIDALPILFINSLVRSAFPWTYFYLEVNESPWLLRGPVFPFLPALVILYDGPHRKAFPGLSACARCRAARSAVRLRVGVFGWVPVLLFILQIIGLCLWFPSWCWGEESACLRDVSGLTVWQHLGFRGALWVVLEAGRNPWSFLFLYFFLSALHNFSCHVLFNWLANLPCRWSLKWVCTRLRKVYLFTSFQRNRVCPSINCHLATA